MKKIFYLIAIFSLTFVSCNDSLEDIHEQIDAEGIVIVGDASFTMSADDYALTNNEDVEEAEAFENFVQAESLIPTMLANKYPVWGKKSSATVSFSFDRLTSIKTESDYTVTPDDYDSQGGNIGRFDNFSSTGEVTAFLASKFTDAVRGDLLDLTHRFRQNGVTSTVTTKFYFTDEWVSSPELDGADYAVMGQRFSNFSDYETAEFRIGIYLGSLYANAFAKAGEKVHVVYNYTYFPEGSGRAFKDIFATFIYDGSKFSVEQNTIQFGHDGNTWVKDNTIKYSFVAEDYATIGASTILEADTEDDFTNALGNLNNFGNFNRSGSSSSWSDRMMIKAMAVFLDSFAPTAADGQKYVLTVSTYGPTPTETFSLIKEAGAWKENK